MKKLNMRENKNKGLLITVCGLDGCGKTTLMNRLISDLSKQHKIFATKQPTNSVRETDIFRTYMDSPDHSAYDYRSLSLLAASDRVQHVNKVIEPRLNKGEIVVSDRYFYSCLANLRARGYVKDAWIYEISESIIKPDIAFFFDVPVSMAVKRVRSRSDEKDRYIDMELQEKLRAEYKKICKANGGILISTRQTEEESYQQMKKAVDQLLQNDTVRSVFDFIKKFSGKDNVELSDKIQNVICADSLELIILLIELEKYFNIVLDQSDLNPYDLSTVNDIVKLVERYVHRDGE